MLNKLHKRELLRQILVFGVVGVCATLTHYLVALGSVTYLSIPVYLANLLGYLTAVGVSLYGHARFSFKMTVNKSLLNKFILVSVGTFLGSEILLFVMESELSLPHEISLGVVVVTIPVISFILNKFWVFTHKNPLSP